MSYYDIWGFQVKPQLRDALLRLLEVQTQNAMDAWTWGGEGSPGEVRELEHKLHSAKDVQIGRSGWDGTRYELVDANKNAVLWIEVAGSQDHALSFINRKIKQIEKEISEREI